MAAMQQGLPALAQERREWVRCRCGGEVAPTRAALEDRCRVLFAVECERCNTIVAVCDGAGHPVVFDHALAVGRPQ